MGAWPGNGDSATANYGIFRVMAPAGGFITRMDKQQAGDFVTEGLPLCSIADPATVLFQLNIPYEEISLILQNPVCRIDLPDGTHLNARITRPLTQITQSSQAAPFLARPETQRFFPEGLIASASLIGYQKKNTRLLPVKAVLSDELMHNFWVMKLISDSPP
ncbi:HlyD family efflux transporter periplasmic adaptor subunit [Puia sp. P3]|uniref:HlyD family efflux transporter periplasmic adaptor subunit n=1 Tax=Puia sp. P3 TaxID=3423952 RepID=UPI003D666E4B